MTDAARAPAIAVEASTVLSALGQGLDAHRRAFAEGRGGLRPLPAASGLATWVGRIDALDAFTLPPPWDAAWDCRATRLAALGLAGDGFGDAVARRRERHGAARIGLVVGTSASTIAASEAAYRALDADGGFPPHLREPRLNTPHAIALLMAGLLGIDGPALTVSTACSSGAKAYATGARWLRLGLVDAVVVGGLDALGDSLLHGFRSLGLLSRRPVRPFAADRDGISIGEAAAWSLLVRAYDGAPADAPRLAGWGESGDAHHMSAPHPEGAGALAAIDAALARAGLPADAVDHVQLHGTGTPQNDAVEAAVCAARYRRGVRLAATKGQTGHAMGAAGALGAIGCLIALRHGLMPGSAPTDTPDPALADALGPGWLAAPATGDVAVAACHAFGFGGTNAVLVFTRGAA